MQHSALTPLSLQSPVYIYKRTHVVTRTHTCPSHTPANEDAALDTNIKFFALTLVYKPAHTVARTHTCRTHTYMSHTHIHVAHTHTCRTHIPANEDATLGTNIKFPALPLRHQPPARLASMRVRAAQPGNRGKNAVLAHWCQMAPVQVGNIVQNEEKHCV